MKIDFYNCKRYAFLGQYIESEIQKKTPLSLQIKNI